MDYFSGFSTWARTHTKSEKKRIYCYIYIVVPLQGYTEVDIALSTVAETWLPIYRPSGFIRQMYLFVMLPEHASLITKRYICLMKLDGLYIGSHVSAMVDDAISTYV